MWGNLQGWIISAVMVLAAGGMLWVIALPQQESAFTNQVPLAFKPVALPDPPAMVIPPGTDPCDAGDLYAEAITAYLANSKQYQDAARVDASQLPALQLLIKAANCSQMHLFDKNPTQVINYDGTKPWVDALMALGQSVNDAGLRLRDDKPEEARKYYEAGFALGEKMFEERVAWPEMNKGLSIMSLSVGSLTRLADNAHNTSRVDVLQKFLEDLDTYHTTLQEKVDSPLGNPVESYSAPFAGDIFAAAKNPAVDRVWRVEAILHLGHYRWMVADDRKGDQTWAVKELHALSISIDPKNQDVAIRTAVDQAQNLTLQQQRLTGS
jgi:hypothetical protein